ncbi:MAG: efflux RND transporter periplasmic adaptor subunit, partial [Zoogloea sp.]|nr:efflux RND transporter periplasmic adaptor subunit [Zoogloea sp.]
MKIRFERPSGTAEQSRGLRVDYSAAKRNIPAWRWNLIVLLLLSPVLYFVGRAVLDQVWVSAPGVVELKRATLHAGLDGRIEFIATAGQRVAAGATLATILPALPLPDRKS